MARPEIIRLRVLRAQNSFRIDDAIASLHPAASKAEIRKWITCGAVYLNGKSIRTPSRIVREGSVIELQIDHDRLKESAREKGDLGRLPRGEQWTLSDTDVLFEDSDLIVVNKPSGLPTQATVDPDRDHLFAAVKRRLASRGHEYVGLHHRLDRDTSGVVLFTKSQRANASIAAQFAAHSEGGLQKVYWALAASQNGVWSGRSDRWRIENFLGRLPSPNSQRAKFGPVKSGGDRAVTDFVVLEKTGPFALVEAVPLTGRTHQIRTHLLTSEAPILGDVLYESRPYTGVHRVMLHARSLTFSHPVNKTVMSINAPLPQDFETCRRQYVSSSSKDSREF